MIHAPRFLRLSALVLGMAVILACAAPFSSAHADVFTVQGIHVDQTADSATAARNAAQAEGQKLALQAVMKKLTLPEDWAALPTADAATVERAVRGFQIASEKTSSTRYIADMIVSFQPEAVRRLLRGASISFAETQARPAVLLAVLEQGSERLLWDEGNVWRDAWEKLEPAGELTPLVLPIGDIMEINNVSAGQALSGDADALTSLAANYGANEVIVASGVLNAAGDELVVSLRRIGGVSTEALTGTYRKGSGTQAEMMQAAAADMLSQLAIQWKRQIIVRDGRLSTLVAEAGFYGLSEWETIRKGLTSTPLVQNIEVSGISARGAEIRISHKGTADMLALSLAQQNVVLSNGSVESGSFQNGYSADRNPRWHLGVRR